MSEERKNMILSEAAKNVSVLEIKESVKKDRSDTTYCIANRTTEALQETARSLPHMAGIGWQLKINEQGTLECMAFSIGNAEISVKDLEWIFKEFNKVESEDSDDQDDFNNGHVYILQSLSDKPRRVNVAREPYSDHFQNDEWINEEDYETFINAFTENGGAAIRFIEGIGEDGALHCRILLSTKQDIPLRIKALLRMLGTGFTVKDFQENDPYDLPSFSFSTFLNAMIHVYLEETLEKARGPIQWELDEEEEDDPEYSPDDEEDQTDEGPDEYLPIDDIQDEKEDRSGQDDNEAPEEDIEHYDGNTLVTKLPISERSISIMWNAGICTLSDFVCLTGEDFQMLQKKGLTYENLKEIEDLLAECTQECVYTKQEKSEISYKEQLDELIGLKEVKEQVSKITAYARMKKDLEALGKAGKELSLHMEFVGNPGTAKTTVARILAGLFHEIGITESDELIEVGRGDLVSCYVGQTAKTVNKIFDKAKGKVLFIDEAYSLSDDRENSFGDEAINTIVQELTKPGPKPIVIFAGYPDKMERFFKRNPGLRSRVPFTINFPDYSSKEMEQIAEMEATKDGFSIRDDAKKKVLEMVSSFSMDDNPGNGRLSRNLVESAILHYASRVYGQDSDPADDAKDFSLIPEDFGDFFEHNEKPKKKVEMGFRL